MSYVKVKTHRLINILNLKDSASNYVDENVAIQKRLHFIGILVYLRMINIQHGFGLEMGGVLNTPFQPIIWARSIPIFGQKPELQTA